MDVTAIVSLISSVGFPIVACGAMAWYVKYQMDINNQQIKALTEEHKAEMLEVTSALNNNTLALQRLCDKLGGVDSDILSEK